MAIHGVTRVALDADAARGKTVFVNRQAARIGGEAESRRRFLDVAARERREVNAAECTTRTKADARWKMFLNDEARSARRERVARRAEERGCRGFRCGCFTRRHD